MTTSWPAKAEIGFSRTVLEVKDTLTTSGLDLGLEYHWP